MIISGWTLFLAVKRPLRRCAIRSMAVACASYPMECSTIAAEASGSFTTSWRTEQTLRIGAGLSLNGGHSPLPKRPSGGLRVSLLMEYVRLAQIPPCSSSCARLSALGGLLLDWSEGSMVGGLTFLMRWLG